MDTKQKKFEIWKFSHKKRDFLIKQGLDFRTQNQAVNYRELAVFRKETAVTSRYLHRGYYCPSPIQDIIVDNARRGKILKRETKRSKPTHRYYFNTKDQLLIAETILCDGSIQTEYLVYCKDAIYGYTYDSKNNLIGVSEECYKDDRIQRYFRASCFNDEVRQWYNSITCIDYEMYQYNDSELSEADFYFATRWNNTLDSKEAADRLFAGGHYSFPLL